MTQVRKENSDSLEYVCPECGDTFEDGAEECASCGLEFDWSEEMEYLCPECGTVVDPDNARCPGCGAKFSVEDEGEITIEYEPEAPPTSVEDMLEEAIDEAIIRPNGTVVRAEATEAAVADRGLRTVPEPDPEPEPDVPEEEPAVEASEEALATESAETYPHLYPGGFTRVGLVFAVLALLALGFSVVMARYDTWIQGAAEESMGDNQRMLFYGGLMAFAVLILLAVFDLFRTPKPKPVE
jgi:DNA-directed RNA polymerase subunit RPC12/RpoP